MSLLTKSYYAMGTKITLSVSHSSPENQLNRGYALIKYYEKLLTVNTTDSEVSLINQAAGKHAVHVSSISYNLIKKAIEISKKNLGFDVAIGPLIKLWHIGFSDAKLPKKQNIEKKLRLIDPKQTVLNDQKKSVFLKKYGMELDLGAIAKGYIADAISKLWRKEKVKRGIINLGGNVLMVGPSPHPNNLWNVGIQDPFKKRNNSLAILKIPALSVVTSGIYERFLNFKGRRYHHILDPKTGYPIKNNLASVTVVSQKSIDGEIWTGIGFYNGFYRTLKLLPPKNLGFIFITKDYKLYITSNIKKNLIPLEKRYQIKEIH